MLTQPSTSSSSFNIRINHQRICLESAFQEGQKSVAGTVRVVNLSFHKTVIVHWTIDHWTSVAETTASFVKGGSQDGTDQFRFKLELGESLAVGGRIKFCLKFVCEGEHWDSNSGANYVFQVTTINRYPVVFLSYIFDSVEKSLDKFSTYLMFTEANQF